MPRSCHIFLLICASFLLSLFAFLPFSLAQEEHPLTVTVIPCTADQAPCPDQPIYAFNTFQLIVTDASTGIEANSGEEGALQCSTIPKTLSNGKELHFIDANNVSIHEPGTYTISAECKVGSANEGTLGQGTSSEFTIIDRNVVVPDDLKDKPGACEICHPDWPGYDPNRPPNERCRGGKNPDEDGWKEYSLKPIETVTCPKGYECVNHLIGCTLPSPGLEPPKQLCQDTNDTSQNCKTALGTIDTSAGEFVQSILGILLSVSGMLALYFIIRSGYQLMMSRGNPEKIGEAKERLTSAIVGLLLIIFSLVILSVIGISLLKIPGFGD